MSTLIILDLLAFVALIVAWAVLPARAGAR